MPKFADASSYLMEIKMKSTSNSLSNILQSIGVKCSPCMQSALRAADTPEKRNKYYQALRATPEQISQIEAILANK